MIGISPRKFILDGYEFLDNQRDQSSGVVTTIDMPDDVGLGYYQNYGGTATPTAIDAARRIMAMYPIWAMEFNQGRKRDCHPTS